MKNHKYFKANNIRHHEISIITFKENVFLQKLCSPREKSEKKNFLSFFPIKKKNGLLLINMRMILSSNFLNFLYLYLPCAKKLFRIIHF